MTDHSKSDVSKLVRVKPLEWRQATYNRSSKEAHCECGAYSVGRQRGGSWIAVRRFITDDGQSEDTILGVSDLRRIAMDDCEDDRARRILACLTARMENE